MAATSPVRSGVDALGSLLSTYAVVAYPFLVGVGLIAVGYPLDTLGYGVEAGVSAATGIIVCAIALIGYGVLWLIGRVGH